MTTENETALQNATATRDRNRPARETTPTPAVKDTFLADLTDMFGAERGVRLFQEGKVTKEDFATFLTLLDKFDADKRLIKRK
jgi:hypothetical protein